MAEIAEYQKRRIERKVKASAAAAATCFSLASVSGADESNQLIAFDGIADVMIGMPLRTLKQGYDHLLVQNDRTISAKELPGATCADVIFFEHATRAAQPTAAKTSSLNVEMGLQTRRGTIARVDLLGEPSVLKTSDGIGIGSSELEVRRIYSNAWIATVDDFSVIDPMGGASGRSSKSRTGFFLRSPDGQRAMLIETDGVEVVSVHVGNVDAFKIDEAAHSILVKPCLVITG
jgi:hypothetical protein